MSKPRCPGEAKFSSIARIEHQPCRSPQLLRPSETGPGLQKPVMEILRTVYWLEPRNWGGGEAGRRQDKLGP